ncbi:hypothetical protein [Dapis sp. BLCC M172]
MTDLQETLKYVRFLVYSQGNKTAVQLSITAWGNYYQLERKYGI